MHFTAAVFTNTTNPNELEDMLTPMLEGNDDYFEFCPSQDPVTEDEAEEWGLVNQDGIWGYMENPNAQFDYWDVEQQPTRCSSDLNDKVPYAFVTLDGVWESCEDFSSVEAWEVYWQKARLLNANTYITYIDCHI